MNIVLPERLYHTIFMTTVEEDKNGVTTLRTRELRVQVDRDNEATASEFTLWKQD